MNVNPNITKLQLDLGFTGKDADGKRGPKTNAAILKAADEGRLSLLPPMVIEKLPEEEATKIDPISHLSATSLGKLAGVHKDLVSVVMETANRSVVPFSVIEGLRTRERQAQLVKQGASKTTDSRHLTGHAVDLWPVDPKTGKNLPSDAAFKRGSAEAKAADARLWADLRKIQVLAKEVAREMGVLLEWGGDWGWDAPHFQLNRAAYPA